VPAAAVVANSSAPHNTTFANDARRTRGDADAGDDDYADNDDGDDDDNGDDDDEDADDEDADDADDDDAEAAEEWRRIHSAVKQPRRFIPAVLTASAAATAHDDAADDDDEFDDSVANSASQRTRSVDEFSLTMHDPEPPDSFNPRTMHM
jgi:hypothetical protein